MRRNLGHRSNDRLARALQLAGQRPEVVQAGRGLRCTICAKHPPPSHQRPGHLKALMGFNHKVYIDGISWSNQAGKSFHFYLRIDAGTNYHVAFCAPSRTTPEVVNFINQHW